MRLIINGQQRDFPTLAPGASVQELIAALDLKGDRVAIEQNGSIVSRSEWASAPVSEEDRLEMVHFVGGGWADQPLHQPLAHPSQGRA